MKKRFPTNKEAFRALEEAFRAEFVTLYKISAYGSDPDLAPIMADTKLRERCLALAWEYATSHPVQVSKNFVPQRKVLLDTAVKGVEAAISFFGERKPEHTQSLQKALADLLQEQKKRSTPLPVRQLGTNHDWHALENLKEDLLPNRILPDAAVAALANLADEAAGHERKQLDAKDVRERLRGLKKRIYVL